MFQRIRNRMRVGFRIGGLSFLSIGYGEVQGHTLHVASWHNPKHMCWLWSLTAERVVADELRAFRIYVTPGPQARYVAQAWNVRLAFTWQAEGRYRSPLHERQENLASRLGVRL